MRSAVVVLLAMGCRGERLNNHDAGAPPPNAPPESAPPADAGVAVRPPSERITGMWLTGLSDDGASALVETLPGTRAPLRRFAIDLATMASTPTTAVAQRGGWRIERPDAGRPCFVHEGGPRYCVDTSEPLDIALSPRGAWAAWTTRDPLQDFMQIHTWNLATGVRGPVSQGLGLPVISDGGRVVVRGPSENCELRGDAELVCWRDDHLVIEAVPAQGTSH